MSGETSGAAAPVAATNAMEMRCAHVAILDPGAHRWDALFRRTASLLGAHVTYEVVASVEHLSLLSARGVSVEAIVIRDASVHEPAETELVERCLGAVGNVPVIVVGGAFDLKRQATLRALGVCDVIDADDLRSLAASRRIAHVLYARLQDLDVVPPNMKREPERGASVLERLAAGVVHDFNNGLTAILIFARLLCDDLSLEDDRRESALEILRAGERAKELAAQLLATSPRPRGERLVSDVATLVRSLDKVLRRTLGPRVELVTLIDDTYAFALIDPGELEQIILNLSINARDAMPRGGKLLITVTDWERDDDDERTAYPPETNLRISVADTGTGIAPEVQQRVFDPMFSTKARGKGTGLGLPMCLAVVRSLGGDIRLSSSVGEDHGTRVDVYLPRSQSNTPTIPPSHDTTRVSGNGEVILVVDDDVHVRHAVSRTLRRAGFQVIETSFASEAIAIIGRADAPLHLLLADLVMPQMSGHELARIAKHLDPRLQVLFMTGYWETTEPNNDTMTKPFRPEELVRRIRELVTPPQRHAR